MHNAQAKANLGTQALAVSLGGIGTDGSACTRYRKSDVVIIEKNDFF